MHNFYSTAHKDKGLAVVLESAVIQRPSNSRRASCCLYTEAVLQPFGRSFLHAGIGCAIISGNYRHFCQSAAWRQAQKEVYKKGRYEKVFARPRALLAALRNADQYSDTLIVVGEHEFAIHRAILARLSKFFSNAFSPGFAESKNKRLVVGEASVKAMSTVLDFAYGIK